MVPVCPRCIYTACVIRLAQMGFTSVAVRGVVVPVAAIVPVLLALAHTGTMEGPPTITGGHS